MTRRVVVSGIGALTAIGSGKTGLWQGILHGKSGIRRLTRFEPTPFRSQIAGEVRDFDPLESFEGRRLKRLDRFAQFSLVAAKQAIEDAGRTSLLAGAAPYAHIGVCTGTALGGVACAEQQHELYLQQGLRAVNPALAFLVFGGSGGSHIAIEFGLTGPGNTNSNSCASGSIAVGEAFRHLQAGRAAAMVAGAAEAPLSPLTFGAFDILRAMSTGNDQPERACRPFDRDRDGFVMGEGAAMLVLETLEQARSRGAHIYAEVLGYACNNDGFHMLQPRPDAACAARCLQDALADAGVSPDAVGYINAHATGTPLGDSAEALAIHAVFGRHARHIPVSSTKPFTAHPLGAAGAIEAAICCLALEHNYLPPTLNLDTVDTDLDCIPNEGRRTAVDYMVSTSFGFGGVNAAIVLGRYAGL
jgi:3-oxoacyl-[acyl-carrier-protein] synthase II